MTNMQATEVLISHNDIEPNWPGRIELWKVNGRYEVRGGQEIFPEGSEEFEYLLDEAMMVRWAHATKLASSPCGLELWEVQHGEAVCHEVRTPEGFVFPDFSVHFRHFQRVILA